MIDKKIRYAVVGLGWIAQDIVLPAFAHAQENSELAALVSDDPLKLQELGDRYRVPYRYSYKDYGLCLRSGHVDAVYIALPNALHREYATTAANAGIHILCEKPMAMDERECKDMMDAARRNNVKLMVAYRLHFEAGNLKAIDIAKSGQLGEVKVFNSTFTQNVAADNVRLNAALSGGTVYDMGVYCINAARGLFRDEPEEVMAMSTKGHDARFKEVDEMTTAILRFPQDRLASFTCSFGAAHSSAYELIGTKGSVRVDPAFSHKGKVQLHVSIGQEKQDRTFEPRDQFAPEILYFSNCILKDKDLEPSGKEGLADVRVIQAIYKSAQSGKPVRLKPFEKIQRPSGKQTITRKGVPRPSLVHAKSPH